jgi:hypothetical protein
MSEKKDISNLSPDKIKKLAREAGLEAREESLNAGLEIMSENENGNLIYERKDENGNNITRPVPEKDLYKQ